MKKIITLLLIFPLLGLGGLYAQKELWGVNSGQGYINPDIPGYFGNITKYDINGENPAVMHEFDSINGYNPAGKLFLASNEKLYGTTSLGGIAGPQGSFTTGGVLFEYDLVLNKYTVLHYFDLSIDPYTINPIIGVIEPSPGILYGATSNRIYKYTIATGAIIFSNLLPFSNQIFGELLKASDGNIYGTSTAGNCPSGGAPGPYQGNYIKYNISTNMVNFVNPINCDVGARGSAPFTQLLEISPGKLIGSCSGGGNNVFTNPFLKGGTLLELDITTSTFTKKVDFDYSLNGVFPLNLVQGDNGKLYGLCNEGGIAPGNTSTNLFDFRGTLFEYTPETSSIVVKQYFDNTALIDLRYPTSLMKTSLGHFVGTLPNAGLFRWNSENNTITLPDYDAGPIVLNGYNVSNLIEICRKPSYRFFDVATFDACIGGTFEYDIQNTNATSYQWLKNNIAVIGQTTGILNLTNLQSTDAGSYTCVMTNECGVTTTMVLNLTVSCLGTNTVAQLDKAIKLYPNPTKNSLNIKLPENIEVSVNNVKIANALGQIVLEQNSENTTRIDVSNLQTGIYIVSLNTNYGNWNGKFVKE